MNSDQKQKIVLESQHLLARGADLESVLASMRKRGCNQIDSIKAIRGGLGKTMAESKKLLHASETWKDHRESVEHLHDAAERALRELADAEDETSSAGNERR